MTIKLEKLLSAIILGLVLGAGSLLQDAHRQALGKDAYLNQQALRFDRFTDHSHAVGMLLAAIIVTFIIVVLYELLLKGFTKFTAKS